GMRGGGCRPMAAASSFRNEALFVWRLYASSASEPAPVEFLQIGVSAGEREIDVVEHAGIVRAGLPRCTGHQPLGKCRDRGSIVVVEARAMAWAMRMPLGSRGWGVRRVVLCVRLRERVGDEP